MEDKQKPKVKQESSKKYNDGRCDICTAQTLFLTYDSARKENILMQKQKKYDIMLLLYIFMNGGK